MLIKRLLASLTMLVALVGGVTHAQDAMAPVGATFDQPSYSGVGSGVNFVSDQLMDYDMQMFAPVDYNLLDENPKPSTGLFFTYDRTMSGITGPEGFAFNGQSGTTFNYSTWGNRFEFGFMGDNDKGWTATIQTMQGSTFLWGRSENQPRPFLLDTKYQSYELNRVFRQELKNGGYFEPFIGGRVMYMSDNTTQDGIFEFIDPTTGLPVLDPDIPEFLRFLQESQNTMLGGTVGARFFKENGPVTWSGNVAATAANNIQFNSATSMIWSDLSNQPWFEDDRGAESNQFVPMIEGRLDLSYALTRDIALRVGGQVMYFVEGLGRANTATNVLNPNSLFNSAAFDPLVLNNNQDTLIYGLTFGVEWRR